MPVDWCVTDGCSASSWFSMKNFQFECCITRWQIGTTSTSPSGERSHMSSKAILASPRNSVERRAVGGEAREDEAAVAVDARGALHAAVGVVARHARALVALGERDRAHAAVEVEAPGVVRADEGAAGVALEVADELHAAVRAAVVEHLHAPSALAHHDHRLAADRHRVVVAGVRAPATRGRSRPRCAPRCAPSRASKICWSV